MRAPARIGLVAALLGVAMVSAAFARDRRPAAGVSPTSLTERNRRIVTDFARLFYDKRDVKGAFAAYVAEDYIQHNPGAADGRAAAIAMLTPLFSGPGARFHVKRIVVDGEMAVIHLHGVPVAGTPGVAVFDMYRLANGKIVEHWDALQPIPAKAANAHPMF